MSGISNITFNGDLINNIQNNKPQEKPPVNPPVNTEIPNDTFEKETADKKEKKVKEKVVYVSKNPDRAVAATGVVAGTSGMVGGAVLGGTVGLSKLPGAYVKALAGQDYGAIVSNSVEGFKNAIKNNPEMANLINTLKGSNSPAVAEEILHIAGTMSERLHGAFANDPHAAAVIDKVLDPIIKGVDVKHNLRNYGSGLRGQIKSPIGQTIMKFLGFNKKMSKVVGGVTGNVTAGFAQAIENIRNFTPEEKQAWGKVAKQMFSEFEHNPKIKASKDILKAVCGLGKNCKWFTDPLKAMQENIINGIKQIDSSLGKAPIKTIGKWSAIGAAACGTLSLLGWAGLKKGLMKKETQRTEMAQA